MNLKQVISVALFVTCVHMIAMEDRPGNEKTYTDDTSAYDSSGMQPLHCAALRGEIPLLSHLVQTGSAVTSLDDLGREPLWYALQAGHLNAALWLLDHGATISTLTEEQINLLKQYPCIYALLSGDENLARELLSAASDNESVNDVSQAFLLAIALQYQAFLQSVLAREDVLTPERMRAGFETAAATNNKDACVLLYEYLKKYLESRGLSQQLSSIAENTLFWASVKGSESIVEFMLERAFAHREIPDLSLTRAVQGVGNILATWPLTDEESRRFNSIQQRLLNAAIIQELARQRELNRQINSSDLPLHIRRYIRTFNLGPQIGCSSSLF